MTQPLRNDENLDDEPRLIELACQIDERLAQNQDSHALIAESMDELSPLQLEELRKAERALAYLQRARRNLDALDGLSQQLGSQDQASMESARIADDSTRGNEDVAPGKKKASPGALPKQLGRFEILDVLGQGGFARVFLARDPRLDRLVALKVPRPDALASQNARQRFEREARAAAMLAHPTIVPIFETGSVGPVSFIAFAYCPGPTLAQWIDGRKSPNDARQAAAIVAELAEAAEHAHQRGVIHRDLKPANILIDGDDSGDIAKRVRITDFGLAKDQSELDQSVTVEGAVIGTPAYMSPEQARGQKQVTAATDVYSLGVILYELLTGRRPFARDSHLATLKAVESELPTPPRKIVPSLAKDLDAICLKCMRKEASQRYATAHELESDLRSWLEGRSVTARHATAWEQLAAWRRRNPALATAVALLAASVVTGLAATSWQWRNAALNYHESEMQRLRAEANVTITQDAIDRMFNSIADDVSVPRSLRNKLMAEAVALQQQLIRNEPGNTDIQLQTAQAHWRLGKLLFDLGQRNEAIAQLDQGLAIFETLPQSAIVGKWKQVRFMLQNHRQTFMITGGSAEENVEPHEPQTKLNRIDALQKAMRLRVAAEAMSSQGNLDAAKQKVIASLSALKDVNPQDKSFLVHRSLGLHTLAQVQKSLGELNDAEQSAAESNELALLAVEQITPRREELAEHAAKGLCLAGDIQQQKGNLAEAIDFWTQAMNRYQAELERFPQSAKLTWGFLYSGSGIAQGLSSLNESEQALSLLRNLATFCDGLEEDLLQNSFLGPHVAATYGDLSVALRRGNRTNEAIAVADRCVQRMEHISDVIPSLRGVQLGKCYARYAEALAAGGRIDDAHEYAQRAAESALDSLQQRPNDVGVAREYERCVGVLAISHCRLGQNNSALACLNELKKSVPRSSIADAQIANLAAACIAELRAIAKTTTTSSTDLEVPFIALCLESLGRAIDQGLDPAWVEKHDVFNELRGRAEFVSILQRKS